MEFEKVGHSVASITGHVVALIGSFFVGLAASGTFWYAILTYYSQPRPSWNLSGFLETSATLLVLSTGITAGFAAVRIKLRGRAWLNYTTIPFVTGGFIAAAGMIVLMALVLWADSIAATGG
jgi:hypothetical protein